MQCKFCNQLIYETEMTEGYPGGPMVYMRGKYRHIKGDAFYCDPRQIDPNGPKPKCHICGTEDINHGGFCSAAGMPPHMPLPLE